MACGGLLRKTATRLTFLCPTATVTASSSCFFKRNFGRNISMLACLNSLSSQSPHLMLSLKDAGGLFNHSLYRLIDKQVIGLEPNNKVPSDAYWCGSSCGWLAYISPNESSCFLMDPLAENTVRVPLPWIGTDPAVAIEEGVSMPANKDKYTKLVNEYVRKIVLSSVPTSPDCVIMAKQAYAYVSKPPKFSNISFCRPGEKSWTSLPSPKPTSYEDICYSHKFGLFYALTCELKGDKNRRIEIWDLKDITSPQCTSLDFKIPPNKLREKCLKVDHILRSISGDILYIERYIDEMIDANGNLLSDEEEDNVSEELLRQKFMYKTRMFYVYRINATKLKFEPVNCLEDEIFFIGKNDAFSVRASDHPELKGNSIYFTDNFLYNESFNPWCGHDMGVFYMHNFSITPHYSFPCELQKVMPPPLWISPKKKVQASQ